MITMKYINIDSSARAKQISRELFKISRPNPHKDDVTKYLFGWRDLGNRAALIVDESRQIPVNGSCDLSILAQSVVNVSDEQIAQLTAYIKQARLVKFGDIIPSGVEFLSEEEIE